MEKDYYNAIIDALEECEKYRDDDLDDILNELLIIGELYG